MRQDQRVAVAVRDEHGHIDRADPLQPTVIRDAQADTASYGACRVCGVVGVSRSSVRAVIRRWVFTARCRIAAEGVKNTLM
jgi:hypothetical protein